VSYALHLLTLFSIYIIVAVSLNLIVGYCGMLTLAHAAYFAVGAYTYALLALKGFGFGAAAFGALVVGAILSVLISLPSWRLKGDLFVLATLAAQVLIATTLSNWMSVSAPIGSWHNLTNGTFGISGIPRPSVPGVAIDPAVLTCVLSVFLALCTFAMLGRLKGSPWGRLLVIMRDDEIAARSLGKNTRKAKLQAIAISTSVVSLAGALYASLIGYIDPSSAGLSEGVLMLSMIIVGGMGNVRGPVIGAVILTSLPEILRFVSFPEAQAANVRALLYGVMLVLFVHFRPQGLAGSLELK
jgi:branched-chain amino acid transport system permease protein